MDGNCTVTLVLLAPLLKGEMLSVFFILCFFVSGPVSFAFFVVPLFLGSFFGKIFGSELSFLGGYVGLVFFGGFLLLFSLYFLAFRSRNCLEKFYRCQVWFFSGFVLFSLGFFVVVVVVFGCCFCFFLFQEIKFR